MRENVICQQTGGYAWQILKNETHVCTQSIRGSFCMVSADNDLPESKEKEYSVHNLEEIWELQSWL